MNVDEEMIIFINKLITRAEDMKSLQNNLKTYKDYLILTESYDENTLSFIEKIINQASNIINMKKDFGIFDIKALIESCSMDKKIKTKKKDRHYEHYSSYSSGCGSSSSSYSSSCGSSPVYRGC